MMHDGEVVTTAPQVRRMVARQFPRWEDRPVTPLPHRGTDHALYRLGDDLLARLPRIDWAVDQVASDRRWLPVLAPHLPVPVPVPRTVGEPDEGYPWPWLVVPWLAGRTPRAGDHAGQERLAVDLAEFVTALQAVPTTGGPQKSGTARGVDLAAMDDITRAAIDECGARVDRTRVLAAWEQALSTAAWTAPPVWLHGDLQSGNLLVRDGRLSGVIDFGGLGLGDPAVDLMPAWELLDGPARATFAAAVGCDPDTWARGRAWALLTALIGLPYYWETAPEFVAQSQRKIDRVLADVAAR